MNAPRIDWYRVTRKKQLRNEKKLYVLLVLRRAKRENF